MRTLTLTHDMHHTCMYMYMHRQILPQSTNANYCHYNNIIIIMHDDLFLIGT